MKKTYSLMIITLITAFIPRSFKMFMALSLMIVLTWCPGMYTLSAQTWAQIGNDINEEGNSVSLSASGKRVAIGTYIKDRVRVYSENAGVWSQLGGDINGEAFYGWFGSAVSMSDDGLRMAIGAPLNDDNGDESGSVRVYKESGGVWTKVGGDIDGEVAGDRFGTVVSLSFDGKRVAIGSERNDGNGTDAGHVRVYKQNGNNWIQIGSDIDGEAADNYFGSSVSLSDDGKTLAVGARRNSGNGAQSGHVRVFRESGGVWTQLGTDIDGEVEGDRFGCSVSLSASGNRLAVGAFFNDGGGTDAGHVRVFSENGGVWTQVGADIDGETEGDWSGRSISLSASGNRVAIGAENNNGNGIKSGHVRVYAESGGTWVQVGADINGEDEYDLSGSSVSLAADGLRVAIGAPAYDLPDSNPGPVRVYDESPCDVDMDGYDRTACGGSDCDDNDASINPGSPELCNGVDDNCNNVVDEGTTDTDSDGICDAMDNCPTTANTAQVDSDGDGIGDVCDACPNDPDNDTDNDGICGDVDNCPSNANSGQEDSDCDTVGNACDVCPGGDDRVDNNNDGIADCNQLLAYAAYSSAWKCGTNKIYVCHSGVTQCISKNQLATHYNHGDKIGPCISCGGQNFSIPGYSGDFDEMNEYPELEIFPNPADDHIQLHYDGDINEIRIISAQGLSVRFFEVRGNKRNISLEQIPSGLYAVMIRSGEEWMIKKFIKL